MVDKSAPGSTTPPPPVLERILCVDDDADIRMIVEYALTELGHYRVCLCESGAAAMEALPSFHPQLLLIDVMMPAMDGPTTLAALRALPGAASLPAVLFTARAQPGEGIAHAGDGIAAIIGKPFDPLTLPDRLEAIWRRIHGCAEG